MAPRPKPPTEIKPPSTGIGIGEGKGGSRPRQLDVAAIDTFRPLVDW